MHGPGCNQAPARKWWGDVSKTAPAYSDYILAHMEAHTIPTRLLVQKLGFWFKGDFWCKAIWGLSITYSYSPGMFSVPSR